MELSVTEIKQRIYSVRGHQVVLDNDLAEFYQTETKALNQAVQRNLDRFPPDFRFRLTEDEDQTLKSQSFFVSSKHGGRRYIPYAYTEHGVAMLSSVLTSGRAAKLILLSCVPLLRPGSYRPLTRTRMVDSIKLKANWSYYSKASSNCWLQSHNSICPFWESTTLLALKVLELQTSFWEKDCASRRMRFTILSPSILVCQSKA